MKHKKDIKILTRDICNLENELFNIDVRIIESEQYSHRENIIISGIPDMIKQDGLERKVLEILQTIGLLISSYEIAACHRLRKPRNSQYPAQTIICFTNRKAVDFCLENRNRLLNSRQKINMNLRFYKNLCTANETVIQSCNKLRQSGRIHDFYIRTDL